MAGRKGDDEVLAVELVDVEALVERLRLRHHRDVEAAVVQQLAEPARHAFEQRDIDARMAMPEVVEKADAAQRADRAHQADVERRVLELEEALGGGPDRLGVLPDLLELRAHQAAEVGQVGEMALAPEQEPAELLLELLDRARQRRLGDVAVLGGAGEVQRLADREEVADLMHFHRRDPTEAWCGP